MSCFAGTFRARHWLLKAVGTLGGSVPTAGAMRADRRAGASGWTIQTIMGARVRRLARTPRVEIACKPRGALRSEGSGRAFGHVRPKKLNPAWRGTARPLGSTAAQ